MGEVVALLMQVPVSSRELTALRVELAVRTIKDPRSQAARGQAAQRRRL